MDIEHGQHNVSLMLFYTTYRNTLCRYNINYMYTMSLWNYIQKSIPTTQSYPVTLLKTCVKVHALIQYTSAGHICIKGLKAIWADLKKKNRTVKLLQYIAQLLLV